MNNFLNNESNLQEDILIGYLNGFLDALGTYNDGPYTGNTFEFSKIANLMNDREESVNTALRHWKGELSQVEDFFQELDKTFNEYGRQHAWSIKERIAKHTNVQPDDTLIAEILAATNYESVKWNFFNALRLLLKENFTAYAVRVKGEGLYEADYKDYFIDCNGSYFYLHFGVSD